MSITGQRSHMTDNDGSIIVRMISSGSMEDIIERVEMRQQDLDQGVRPDLLFYIRGRRMAAQKIEKE